MHDIDWYKFVIFQSEYNANDTRGDHYAQRKQQLIRDNPLTDPQPLLLKLLLHRLYSRPLPFMSSGRLILMRVRTVTIRMYILNH